MGGNSILITGGCGHIGVNLARYLQLSGYKVKILDNLSVGNESNLSDAGIIYSQSTVLIGDIRDISTVKDFIKDVGTVVHLAAFTRVVESLEKPREVWDINVNGTLGLLELCRGNGIKKFVYASSNAAVGDCYPPFKETLPLNPISPMGASKAAGEMLCLAYGHSYGVESACLRFSNCYGIYSRHKTSVIAKFIKLLMKNEPLIIYGDGNQSRDFVNVLDVCNAIELCIRKSNIGGVYQIASGVETTINLLASMVKDIGGSNVEIIYKPARAGEIQRNYSDIAKAENILGYKPKVRLNKGLVDLWGWYRRNDS